MSETDQEWYDAIEGAIISTLLRKSFAKWDSRISVVGFMLVYNIAHEIHTGPERHISYTKKDVERVLRDMKGRGMINAFTEGAMIRLTEKFKKTLGPGY